MSQKEEIARLARDEHEERENRRHKKRRLRGHKQAAPIPRTIRAQRTDTKRRRRK